MLSPVSVWVLHLANGPPKIWIRDSQNKINLSSLHNVNSAHRIFDLLAPSRVTGPSHLSSQTLANLAHGRVPLSVLKELMADLCSSRALCGMLLLLAAHLSASVTFSSVTSSDGFWACGSAGAVTLTHTSPLIHMANPNEVICQFTEDAFADED
ncbi:hypothetical protein BDR07DRAFT_1483338 [Suillus spraguei]|nr:hypothetical protein BDR07DRAFT_1483338 [Suillus spraguei]